MMPFPLALALPEDDGAPWELLIWAVIFIIIPLGSRILKWIAEKLGAVPSPELDSEDEPGSKRQRVREALQELERRGAERWREMTEGHPPEVIEEAEAPPPMPARSTVVVPVTSATPIESTLESAALPSAVAKGSGLGAGLPDADLPLSDIGHTLDEGAADWRSESTVKQLGALTTTRAQGTKGRSRRSARSERRFGSSTDWRRAMVLREVLGPPIALRRAREPGRGG